MSQRPPTGGPLATVVHLDPVTITRADFFGQDGRYVVRGDTWAVQDELLASGCTWSPDERAWIAAAEAAERLVAALGNRARPETVPSTRLPTEEQGLVNGWGRQGLPADARERRLNRLARLAPEDWVDEEVLEILVGFAFPDQGPDLAAWLLQRFGGFGPVLAAEAARYAEHPALAANGWPITGEQWPLLAFACFVAAMITYKHRSNIKRLLAGTESSFAKKAPDTSASSPQQK